MRPILILLLMFTSVLQAQSTDWNKIAKTFQHAEKSFSEINTLAVFIEQHFEGNEQQAAAVYWWLGNQIRYDLQSLRSRRTFRSQSQDKITTETFQKRKGVCEGYAGIMDSLFKLLEIPSFFISGYTRQGNEISAVPHAWVAAKLNEKWRFFDPTWASGFLNGKRFEAKFNTDFFNIDPEQMRKTHMPYDPIWQFSDEPITHQEFILNEFNLQNITTHFDYIDSINLFVKLDLSQKLLAEYNRILKNYYPHQAVKTRLDFLSSNLDIARHNSAIGQMNAATTHYNNAATSYNNYVKLQQQRNQSNRETKKSLLIQAANEIAQSDFLIRNIGEASTELKNSLNTLQKAVNSLKKQLEKEGVLFE
ncbi:MAG: hypothetical protein PF694_00295 [Bacteroidetes bacterium]|jgi:hypothetical protein|nr:hypothetical protein [Bacteroidota bacterium]